MGGTPPRRRRESARDGFNIGTGGVASVYTPRGGELRRLKFGIKPDVKRALLARPELLDLLAAREMLMWIGHMEKRGYTLVSRPSKPARVPSPNPDEPGWDWCFIEARWFHHGPVAVLPRDVLESKREEEQRIGAGQLTSKTGVREALQAKERSDGGEVELLGGDHGDLN